MAAKDLSDNEKQKKQEEITKRLAEIKNRLNKGDKKESNQPKASASADKPATKSAKDDKKESTPKPKSLADEKRKNEPVKKPEVKKVEPVKKPDESFKMAGKPTKDKGWSNNKIKKEDIKKSTPETSKVNPAAARQKFKPNIQQKKKKKNRTLLILTSVVLLLLASALVWFFLILPSQNADLDNLANNEVTTEASADQSAGIDAEDELQAMEDVMTEEDASIEEDETMELNDENDFETETMAKPKKSPKVEPTSTPPPSNNKPASSSITRTSLNTPCFVISYVSVSEESAAKKEVAALKGKGLTAGYYWIPDYTEGGSELFKVFVGPYPNRQSVHSDLDRIRGYKKDVYYHIVE